MKINNSAIYVQMQPHLVLHKYIQQTVYNGDQPKPYKTIPLASSGCARPVITGGLG